MMWRTISVRKASMESSKQLVADDNGDRSGNAGEGTERCFSLSCFSIDIKETYPH